MMLRNGKKLDKKVEVLKKGIAELNIDIHALKNILLKVDFAEQEEKDKEELEKIEAQIK